MKIELTDIKIGHKCIYNENQVPCFVSQLILDKSNKVKKVIVGVAGDNVPRIWTFSIDDFVKSFSKLKGTEG